MSSPSPETRRDNAAYRNVDVLFDESAERVGLVEKRYGIAGRSVLMRYAGPAMLQRLGLAFSHLDAETADEPALRINIWDSASTGSAAPPILGDQVEASPNVEQSFHYAAPVYYFEENGIQALGRWSTLSVYDREMGEAWLWAPDPATMLSWDWATPLRAILDWWLGDNGIQQVHGGAIGLPDRGVLVTGAGGSGKSTTTLSCLNAGLLYVGDDWVAIEGGESPYIHSLYCSGKLESRHSERFPALLDGVANPVRGSVEKAVVYADRLLGGVASSGFPLRAVLVPRITGRLDTRLVPASPLATLTALAPTTIFESHPSRPTKLAQMASIVRSVPCYSLELGTDLDQIPSVIVDLLQRV